MAANDQSQLASLETRYCARIAWRYETVEFLGLPYLKEERPLTLSEIYIPLSLTWEQSSEERLYVPDALQQSPHLVVLGDPGSGKSTLVQLLAYSFGRIEPTPLARRLGPHLPIPIILRDYKVRNWQTPDDMLRDFIAQLDDDVRSEVTVEWLMAALNEGRGILLIDGLDEVGSRADRLHLRDNIVWPLLAKMPDSLAVLTSRIVGYEEATIEFASIQLQGVPGKEINNLSDALRDGRYIGREYFKRCFVAPFGDEEIEQFIQKWYAARERDERKRRESIDSLRAALQQNDRIKRLATNPSLLTLMALIHRVTAQLPSGRVKLYDKITEAYLETLQRVKGLRGFEATLEQMKPHTAATPQPDRSGFEATLEQMKLWLAQIGWEMQNRRSGEQKSELRVEHSQVREWLCRAMAKDSLLEPSAQNLYQVADEFLDYVARRSGLLIPRGQQAGEEQYAFVHLTFQEYFAAWHLRAKLRRFDQLADLCAAHVTERHWHETLVLLFELLAEFPGAGDDLVDELVLRSENDTAKARGAAELFTELLLDEQNGLSLQGQHKVVAYALKATCENYNEKVVGSLADLRQRLPERFSIVSQWLNQQFQNATPETLGANFFLVAEGLEDDAALAGKLRQWVHDHGDAEWSDWQIEQVVTLGGWEVDVCAWGAERLPFKDWLAEDFIFYVSNSLIDRYEPNLLQTQGLSSRHNLLAQLGAAYSISRTHTLHFAMDRALALALDRDRARDLALDRDRDRDLARALDLARARALDRDRDRDRDRALDRARALALALALDRDRDRARARALARDLAEIVTSAGWPSYDTGLATEVARTEWIFGYPDCPPQEFQEHIERLDKLADAPDDWTRLLSLTSLMLLGEGSVERCAERNRLLDFGMTQSKKFSFPEDVHEATDNEQFRRELPEYLQHIFLHEPGDPWLKPEWFDPSHRYARVFLANPRQFYAIAAEVLDPTGKTELAKWRDASAVAG